MYEDNPDKAPTSGIAIGHIRSLLKENQRLHRYVRAINNVVGNRHDLRNVVDAIDDHTMSCIAHVTR